MKKTILSVIIVIVLVAATALLSACGTKMFPINEERAGKQVTATVEYNGRTAIVSVDEVYNSFYNYYNYLYTYYQYGYLSADLFQSYMDELDETFKSTNESLAKSSLYNLKCIEYLTEYFEQVLDKNNEDENKRLVAMRAASTVGHTYNFSQVSELARFKAERIAEIEMILACYTDYSYVNAAIRSANSDMQSRFDSYVETVRAEYEALEGTSKDTTPEGFSGISITQKPYRLVYEVNSDGETLDLRGMEVVANYAEANDEHGTTVVIPNKYLVTSGFDAKSAADDQEITVTYGGKTATFTVDVVTARPTRETPAKADTEDKEDDTQLAKPFSFEVNEADYIKEGMQGEELEEARQELKIARNAMSRLNKYLKDNYRDYNDYLYGYVNTQLRNLTQNVRGAQIQLQQTELDTEYERLIAERKAQLAQKTFAKDDLDTFEKSLLQPVEESYGYYYVSQVLFKFTDEQTDAITAFKDAKNANETAILNYTVNKAKEIGVWLSNPDYDKDAKCELEQCACPHCANYVAAEGAEHIAFETLEDWYTCDADCACVACPSKKYTNTTPISVMDVIAEIEADLDAVNADASVTEQTLTYRETLLETINAWIYKANEDSGAFSAITSQKYGYVMTPERESSGMVETFELACDALAAYNGTDTYKGKSLADAKAELAQKGVFVESDRGGVGSYAWCVSDYGIHFVVLTAYAVDESIDTVLDTTINGKGYKQLGQDYVYSSYEFDDSDDASLSVLQADNSTVKYPAGTVGAKIGKDLLDEKVTADYARFQRTFIDDNQDKIEYMPDGYQYILKKVRDATKTN